MNHAEAIAYLLKNGFRLSLIDRMSKKRCIEVAIKHKESRSKEVHCNDMDK